jgi:hypothetical protein
MNPWLKFAKTIDDSCFDYKSTNELSSIKDNQVSWFGIFALSMHLEGACLATDPML